MIPEIPVSKINIENKYEEKPAVKKKEEDTESVTVFPENTQHEEEAFFPSMSGMDDAAAAEAKYAEESKKIKEAEEAAKKIKAAAEPEKEAEQPVKQTPANEQAKASEAAEQPAQTANPFTSPADNKKPENLQTVKLSAPLTSIPDVNIPELSSSSAGTDITPDANPNKPVPAENTPKKDETPKSEKKPGSNIPKPAAELPKGHGLNSSRSNRETHLTDKQSFKAAQKKEKAVKAEQKHQEELHVSEEFVRTLSDDDRELFVRAMEYNVKMGERGLKDAQKDDGWISGSWNYIKNAAGMEYGTDAISERRNSEKRMIEDVKSGKTPLGYAYKKITGNELNQGELDRLLHPKANPDADKNDGIVRPNTVIDVSNSRAAKDVNGYKEGREQSVDTAAMAAGAAVSMTGAGVIVTAGTYFGVKAADGLTSDNGYTAEEGLRDLSQAALTAVTGKFGAGAGKYVSKAAGKFFGAEAASVIIGTGKSAGDYVIKRTFNGEEIKPEELRDVILTSGAASLTAGGTAYGTSNLLNKFIPAGANSVSQTAGRLLKAGVSGGTGGTAAAAGGGLTNYLLHEKDITFDGLCDAAFENAPQGFISGYLFGTAFEAGRIAKGMDAPQGADKTKTRTGRTEKGVKYTEYLDKDGRVLARDISAKDAGMSGNGARTLRMALDYNRQIISDSSGNLYEADVTKARVVVHDRAGRNHTAAEQTFLVNPRSVNVSGKNALPEHGSTAQGIVTEVPSTPDISGYPPALQQGNTPPALPSVQALNNPFVPALQQGNTPPVPASGAIPAAALLPNRTQTPQKMPRVQTSYTGTPAPEPAVQKPAALTSNENNQQAKPDTSAPKFKSAEDFQARGKLYFRDAARRGYLSTETIEKYIRGEISETDMTAEIKSNQQKMRQAGTQRVSPQPDEKRNTQPQTQKSDAADASAAGKNPERIVSDKEITDFLNHGSRLQELIDKGVLDRDDIASLIKGGNSSAVKKTEAYFTEEARRLGGRTSERSTAQTASKRRDTSGISGGRTRIRQTPAPKPDLPAKTDAKHVIQPKPQAAEFSSAANDYMESKPGIRNLYRKGILTMPDIERLAKGDYGTDIMEKLSPRNAEMVRQPGKINQEVSETAVPARTDTPNTAVKPEIKKSDVLNLRSQFSWKTANPNANPLDAESIQDRIRITERQQERGFRLVEADLKRLDELWSRNDFSSNYISPDGENAIPSGNGETRLDGFRKFLTFGQDIEASEIIFRVNSGGLPSVNVNNRHRLRVLMENLDICKIAVHQDSIEALKDAGVIISE